jgi:hypothetical protein
MEFNKKIFCGLIVLFACPVVSYATDMYGNPTEIGKPGQFEIQIGGGRSSGLGLDAKQTLGATQIGNLSTSQSVPANTSTFEEDQVVIVMSYALNARTQLFVNLGTGKGNGKDTGKQSNSQGVGFKISSSGEPSEIKMGLMVRAQQVTIDIDGPFILSSPYNSINDGVNVNYFPGPVNATEQIKYTRIDAFFGASRNSGIFRPYGGLGLTRISGTDSFNLDGTVPVYSYPVGGGPSTSSTQHVAFSAKSDISGSRYFSGVLGLSINPDSELGMTAELQIGVQNTFMLAGNIRF